MKSHGTLECVSDEQNVLLTAEDLRYLASECDKLEQTISALQMKGDPTISYVYHHHTGSPAGGGCYTAGYHTHSDSCPTTVVNYGKTHSSSKHDTVCAGCNRRDCDGKHTYYDCHDKPITGYNIGCGWQEGAIERAEIVFKPVK